MSPTDLFPPKLAEETVTAEFGRGPTPDSYMVLRKTNGCAVSQLLGWLVAKGPVTFHIPDVDEEIHGLAWEVYDQRNNHIGTVERIRVGMRQLASAVDNYQSLTAGPGSPPLDN